MMFIWYDYDDMEDDIESEVDTQKNKTKIEKYKRKIIKVYTVKPSMYFAFHYVDFFFSDLLCSVLYPFLSLAC